MSDAVPLICRVQLANYGNWSVFPSIRMTPPNTFVSRLRDSSRHFPNFQIMKNFKSRANCRIESKKGYSKCLPTPKLRKTGKWGREFIFTFIQRQYTFSKGTEIFPSNVNTKQQINQVSGPKLRSLTNSYGNFSSVFGPGISVFELDYLIESLGYDRSPICDEVEIVDAESGRAHYRGKPVYLAGWALSGAKGVVGDSTDSSRRVADRYPFKKIYW